MYSVIFTSYPDVCLQRIHLTSKIDHVLQYDWSMHNDINHFTRLLAVCFSLKVCVVVYTIQYLFCHIQHLQMEKNEENKWRENLKETTRLMTSQASSLINA